MSKDTEGTPSGVLGCTVRVEGSEVPGAFALCEARVCLGVNRIGKARLEFEISKGSAQDMDQNQRNLFTPGKALRLDAGSIKEQQPIFEGVIVSLGIQVESSGYDRICVECRDYAFAATLSRNNHVFEDSTDSEAIDGILKEYPPLKAETDTTDFVHPALVQYYCSDWDFILSRAEANGLVVVTTGKKICVKQPKLDASSTLKVTYGVNLYDFNGSVDARHVRPEVEVCSWDAASQKTVLSSSPMPALNKQGSLKPASFSKQICAQKVRYQSDIPAKKGWMDSLAKSLALRRGLAMYRGSFSFAGNAKAVPGSLVELEGLGALFDGLAFAAGVEHAIDQGQWTTTVQMGLDPSGITEEPDVMAPSAAGILPGIRGLHIGKVKQLDEDPGKEHRIAVEIPLLEGKKRILRARLSGMYASSKAGCYFPPEVGDEVLVGFLNEDPCHPVILGSMHSSKIEPPYPYKAENDIKALISRSGNKLEINEKDNIMTLKTCGGNTLTLDDKDKSVSLQDVNGNHILLNKDGITLKSAKDLLLKAGANIRIEAGAKASLKANTDLEMEALNVKGTAKVGMTLKGNATAELSASGSTTIKGAMVMIN